MDWVSILINNIFSVIFFLNNMAKREKKAINKMPKNIFME